jgi:hypothetical protein
MIEWRIVNKKRAGGQRGKEEPLAGDVLNRENDDEHHDRGRDRECQLAPHATAAPRGRSRLMPAYFPPGAHWRHTTIRD